MSQRINIKKEVYRRSNRKKEQEKIRYNKKVKTQYFTLNDLILFKDLTFHLGKLIEQ